MKIKLLHGSPGYLQVETLNSVAIVGTKIELMFDSECFTQLTPTQFSSFLNGLTVHYRELHGGFSEIVRICE